VCCCACVERGVLMSITNVLSSKRTTPSTEIFGIIDTHTCKKTTNACARTRPRELDTLGCLQLYFYANLWTPPALPQPQQLATPGKTTRLVTPPDPLTPPHPHHYRRHHRLHPPLAPNFLSLTPAAKSIRSSCGPPRPSRTLHPHHAEHDC